MEAGRRLMEAAPSGDVSVVKTAEELIAAVERGDQHIELHDHIDFTSSSPRTPYYHDGKLSGFDRMLGTLSKTTQSIRGSCGHPPPAVLTGALSGAAIPEDLAGRKLCMVVTDGALLATQGGRLWLDGIFIRYQKTPRSACFDNGILQLNGEEKENASAWMTSMTVQGYDGRAQGQDCDRYLGGVAIAMQSAQLFAEGSAFEELGGFHTIEAFGNQHIGSTVNLVRCRFTDNYAAVAVLTASGDDVSVRIEQSVFTGNTLGADSALLESQGDSDDSAVQFFSDASIPVHDIFSSQRSTLSLADWPEGIELTAEDSFLAGLQQSLPHIERSPVEGAPQTTVVDKNPAPADFPLATPAEPPVATTADAGPPVAAPPPTEPANVNESPHPVDPPVATTADAGPQGAVPPPTEPANDSPPPVEPPVAPKLDASPPAAAPPQTDPANEILQPTSPPMSASTAESSSPAAPTSAMTTTEGTPNRNSYARSDHAYGVWAAVILLLVGVALGVVICRRRARRHASLCLQDVGDSELASLEVGSRQAPMHTLADDELSQHEDPVSEQ